MATNNIKVPYKMLYLDSRSVTCPFRACNYNLLDVTQATSNRVFPNTCLQEKSYCCSSRNNYSVLDNNLIIERDPSCFQGNYQLVLTFMLTSNKSVTWQASALYWPEDACHVTITCWVSARYNTCTMACITFCSSQLHMHRFRYPQGVSNIWLDGVSCFGSEARLQSCSHNSVGSHNCRHNEDVAVSCFGLSTADQPSECSVNYHYVNLHKV